MSHIYIIQLATEPIDKETEGMTYCDYTEDPLFIERTDYGGDPVSEEDPDILDAIARELEGVATLDKENLTITFAAKDEIKTGYLSWLTAAFINHSEKLSKESKSEWWKLHKDVENVFGIDDLFYLNGYCHCAGRLLEDYINGQLPQTVHIGNIHWAHC